MKSNNRRMMTASLVVLTAAALGLGLANRAPALASTAPVISETFTQNAGTLLPVSGGGWAVSGGTYNLSAPATAKLGNGNISLSSTPLTGDFDMTVSGRAATPSGEFSVIFDYADPQHYSYAHFSTVLHDFAQGIFKVDGAGVN